MVDVFTLIILIVDFAFSIWNSYSAGLSWGMLRGNSGPGWAYLSPVLGLSLGLVGGIYVTSIAVGFAAYLFGFVDPGTVDLLLAYNFLITGLLIIVLGVGVTIQSIYVAAKRPTFWSVGAAIFNTFASIWNVFVYMRNFGPLESLVNQERKSEDRSGLATLIILAVIVVLLGILMTFVSFNAGRKRGEGQRLRSIQTKADFPALHIRNLRRALPWLELGRRTADSGNSGDAICSGNRCNRNLEHYLSKETLIVGRAYTRPTSCWSSTIQPQQYGCSASEEDSQRANAPSCPDLPHASGLEVGEMSWQSRCTRNYQY